MKRSNSFILIKLVIYLSLILTGVIIFISVQCSTWTLDIPPTPTPTATPATPTPTDPTPTPEPTPTPDPTPGFPKNFGDIMVDKGYDIIEKGDGGYIIVGTTRDTDDEDFDVYILTLDADGNETWHQTYGGSSDEYGCSIAQTADGSFAIGGYIVNPEDGTSDMLLMKISNGGALSWTQTYDNLANDEAYGVDSTSDNGFILAGYTADFDAGICDIYIVKTDLNGNVSWDKTIGGASYEKAYDVIEIDDIGFVKYIVAGYTESDGDGMSDAYLIKLDEASLVEWAYPYGGSDYEKAFSLYQTSDGGFIIAGSTTSYGEGETDFYVLKITSTGNVGWNKTYGDDGYDTAYDVIQSSDGGYFTVGYIENNGSYDVHIVKILASGSKDWESTIEMEGDDKPHACVETPSGDLLITGWTNSFGYGDYDVMVIKIDSAGNLIEE